MSTSALNFIDEFKPDRLRDLRQGGEQLALAEKLKECASVVSSSYWGESREQGKVRRRRGSAGATSRERQEALPGDP